MENFDLKKLKKLYPFVDKAVDNNGLITSIIILIVAAAIGGALIGFVPILGWILGFVIELWFVIGLILSVMTYLNAQNGGPKDDNGDSAQ